MFFSRFVKIIRGHKNSCYSAYFVERVTIYSTFEHTKTLKTKEMKFTIELTEAQVKGIKEYLKDVSDIEKPSKKDIQSEINGMLSAELQSGSVYDYISKYEK